MDEKYIGNVVKNDTCENVHILNELNVPVLAMGLKDVVIAASPEGILVSDKEKSAHIKPYVDNLGQQVMFADKSWGNYRVLSIEAGSLTVMVTLNQGHSMNYHSHQHRDEVWTVLSGYGHTILDGDMQNIKAGDVINMPAGCKHTVFADTELKLLEVQLGRDISVSDKIKHDFEPDTKCFGKGDIRGIYPTQVNEELAYRIGRYFKEVIDEAAENSRPRIAVGHDIRLSGPSLKKALVKGLTESGCDVVDIGQCGTEMIYFAAAHLKLDGGIMITASHNPKAYNGFKLVRSGARPVSETSGLRELEALCSREPAVLQEQMAGDAGCVDVHDILPEYVEHLLGYVDVDAMWRLAEQQGRRLRVVVNAGNGAAGPVLDVLAEKLPFEFIKVHNQPDGNFPNGVSNPLLRENRDATADVVRKYGADVGIAWDGDFDRCFLFDEEGGMIEGYYMVGFLAQAFLKKYPGARIIHGPRVYWNTQAICQEFGGEMSAHHYFRDFAYCDSGMIPWLLVLELLQQRGRKLSELLAERLDMYPCSGEINSKVASTESASRLAEYVEAQYADGVRDYTDGLSVAYPGWRFNLRKSNTEPVVRLNVETAGDKKLLQEKTDELLQVIRSEI